MLSSQDLAAEVYAVSSEATEVFDKTGRVDALRRKKVLADSRRVAESKRRAALMNAKVAEMHALASAKLVAAKDHILGHGTVCGTVVDLATPCPPPPYFFSSSSAQCESPKEEQSY